MKQKLLFVAFLSVLVFITSSHPRHRQAGVPANGPAGGGGAAGYILHVDPESHEFVEAPVFTESDPFSDRIDDALNFSTEGLVEKPSDVEGGGVMVDLQGRFRNTSVITINADGTLSAPCIPARPEYITEETMAVPQPPRERTDAEGNPR